MYSERHHDSYRGIDRQREESDQHGDRFLWNPLHLMLQLTLKCACALCPCCKKNLRISNSIDIFKDMEMPLIPSINGDGENGYFT